jgi:hypothetical protein
MSMLAGIESTRRRKTSSKIGPDCNGWVVVGGRGDGLWRVAHP